MKPFMTRRWMLAGIGMLAILIAVAGYFWWPSKPVLNVPLEKLTLGDIPDGLPKEIECLISQTFDQDEEVRSEAVRELSNINHLEKYVDVVIPFILRVREQGQHDCHFLFNDDECERRQVVEAIRRIGAPAIPHLARPLTGNPDLWLLSVIDDPAVNDVLFEHVDNPDADLRSYAIRGLVERCPTGCLKVFQKAMHDQDEGVRQSAVKGLGALADPTCIEELLSILRTDSSDRMRCSAASALGKLRPSATVTTSALLAALRTDPNRDVRGCAADALGKLRPLPTIVFPTLLELLDHSNWMMRQSAVSGLSFTKDSRAIPVLIRLMEDPEEILMVRATAGYGLANFDASEEVMEALYRGLKDPEALIQYASARSLGQLKAPAAVEPLLEYVRGSCGPQHESCYMAIVALGHISTPEAIDGLERMILDRKTKGYVLQYAKPVVECLQKKQSLEPLQQRIDQRPPL